jgi:nicotinamide mononucleotide adenylyltransferase
MNIGIVPVSAKPYHVGHHALVTRASDENDKVFLFVSTSDRKRKGEVPILGADMEKVWQEEIEKILPGNVTVTYGGSPVQRVYSVLEDAEQEIIDSGTIDDIYTVYSDPVDTQNNYSLANREKYFPTAYKNGNVVFAAEANPASFTRGEGTPDVSGTAVRKTLQACDFDAFSDTLPPGVDKEKIFNLLCPAMKEGSLVRQYIKYMIKG